MVSSWFEGSPTNAGHSDGPSSMAGILDSELPYLAHVAELHKNDGLLSWTNNGQAKGTTVSRIRINIDAVTIGLCRLPGCSSGAISAVVWDTIQSYSSSPLSAYIVRRQHHEPGCGEVRPRLLRRLDEYLFVLLHLLSLFKSREVDSNEG
jgi:hypothetical protein